MCLFSHSEWFRRQVLEAGPDGKLMLRESGVGRWLLGPAISLSKCWLVGATNVSKLPRHLLLICSDK